MGVLDSEDWKACALPWKLAWIVGGTCSSAIAWLIAVTAGPSGALPFRLKLRVTEGNCP